MEDAELRNILFSIQGSIAGFQNDMSDVKNDIADMKTDIANMKTDITNMKTDICLLYTSPAIQYDEYYFSIYLNSETAFKIKYLFESSWNITAIQLLICA